MAVESYRVTLNVDLGALVFHMREAQKKYFSTRDRHWLMRSKQLEEIVDGLIEDAFEFSRHAPEIPLQFRRRVS